MPLARDDYGSRLRDGAGLVTLVAETGIAKTEAPRLVTSSPRPTAPAHYTSTQEQAWMLLAAKALGDEQAGLKPQPSTARPHRAPILRTLTPEELEKGIDHRQQRRRRPSTPS